MDSFSERRSENRLPHSEAIELQFDDPNPATVSAELVEVSERGFRATHHSNALRPGLEVKFHRHGTGGVARVIWTHVLEGRSVSGFLILSSMQKLP